MKPEKVIESMRKKLRPSLEKEKQLKTAVNEFLNEINKKLSKLDAQASLGGSGAKGTWLDSFDMDVFVKFNYAKYKDKDNKLSDLLGQVLKIYKPERLHGSRDYFSIKKGGHSIEVVPILDIKKAEEAKNITDVSPLHTKYVNKKLNKAGKDEVRLLKKFLRAGGIYGAESYIKGFSGYVCELLIINYGSFLNTIKSSLKWKEKILIDIEDHHKGKKIEMEINKAKLLSPIIIIDPVQPDRNAAAAVSEESYELFKDLAKHFLKKPSEKYFEESSPDIDELKKKHVVLSCSCEGKRDVAGSKLLKVFEYLISESEKYGFKIKSKGWHYNDNEAVIWVSADDVSKLKIVKGPPVKMKEHSSRFRKAHKKVMEKSGVLQAEVERDHTKIKDFLSMEIKSKYVKERCSGKVLQ